MSTTTPTGQAEQAHESHDDPRSVQRRVAMLRAEIEATTDKHRQAALHYELGSLVERRLKNDAIAVKEYLTAYNLAPAFRPPLFALIRIFERRRSFKNLARLYDAEARSAATPEDRASGFVDRGTLTEDRLDDVAAARDLYRQALEVVPSYDAAALMLERSARGAADHDVLVEALKARLEAVRDETLKSLIQIELAWEREADDDLDGAFAQLREAAALPTNRFRVLEAMERIGRKHDRWGEVIQALEARAKLLAGAARGEDQGIASGAFSVRRFADQARAGAEAAALFHEAARLRISQAGDPAGAITALDEAIAMRPEDVLLREERMLASELAGDVDGAGEQARHLLERGVSGRFASALHFRLAEVAQVEGDTERARAALNHALEADPASAAAGAMLDDLLLDEGRHEERVAQLERRAQDAKPAARSRALWRAGQIAAEQVRDFDRASRLYEAAAADAEEPTAIWRELYGASLRNGAAEVSSRASTALLASTTIDDEERSTLLRDRYELLRYVVEDEDAARASLKEAMTVPAAAAWAPEAARLDAASRGDHALLAQAHRMLSEQASEDESASAHLCASARALVLNGDQDGAMKPLREALARSPGHRYAVALLEEVLRSRGEAEEVVTLLREAAEAQSGAKAAEANLLLAGAAAEASGDLDLAVTTYEEAAERNPTSLAPLWSLRRLAEKTTNEALLLSARKALSEREIANGEPGRATFELGEHHDLVEGKHDEAATALRSSLMSDTVGQAAAVSLLLLPGRRRDENIRVEALTRLITSAPEDDVPHLLRVLGGDALATGDATRAEETISAMLAHADKDRWAHLARLRLLADAPDRVGERAEAWIGLANASDDPEAAAELLLTGLRAKLVAQGEDAADDAFLLAQEIAAVAPDAPASGVALDETLAAGDDPEARAEALKARLLHSGRLGDGELRAAVGRALVASGRGAEALEALGTALGADPNDLSSWEALRVAAREERRWDRVVAACDKLADNVTGELRAQLLEEAAAALMDELGDDAGAERRLRAALQIDPGRTIAYGRLHDLLAEREDTDSLLTIVTARVGMIDDSDELVKLLYEQARLLRAKADRPGALGALDNLLMLEDDHVGGLALKVEIHVSLEQWEEAVNTLRELTSADVPTSQKRLAHLGAADFLEKKLGDALGAMSELSKIAELGLGDGPLYARIADVAERAERAEDAVQALELAAGHSSGALRASYEKRAGLILESLGRTPQAAEAYGRALDAVPTDLDAGEALARTLVDPARREAFLTRYDDAVRRELGLDPVDEEALRKLAQLGVWRGDADLTFLALSALSALGLALPEELDVLSAMATRTPTLPSGTLSETSVATLRADGWNEAVSRLASLVSETVAEVDRLQPATYGVGRGNLISPKKEEPVRAQLSAVSGAFGVLVTEFYRGGGDAALVAAMPGKKGPAWVVGDAIRPPLDAAQRFLVGQLAFALHEATLPFVQRAPREAATVLFAAAAAAEAPLAAAGARSGLEELTRAVAKRMPRKVRKAIPELARTLPSGGAGVEPWCRASVRGALRAGTLVSGNLAIALGSVLGGRPSPGAVQASDDARDLVIFWYSKPMLALRRELGLAL